MSQRVLLLLPTSTYKAEDFLRAAERLGLEVVVGTERRQALDGLTPGACLTLDLSQVERSVERIERFAAERPLAAVVGVDDETLVLAARAAACLGLRHNPATAVQASRDKFETRRRLESAGLRGPRFRRIAVDDDPAARAQGQTYPAVLKPLGLSASRGVIRVDDEREFIAAHRRIAAILSDRDVSARNVDRRHLLVEQFLPGTEVALEGLLEDGRLRVLALFDKPDPLDGPTFEETLYVTPSRLDPAIGASIIEETERGCDALGLLEGPVHAELRLVEGMPVLLEIAARTIGGLCARTLRFGAGLSLEELVLRHALGLEIRSLTREADAAGVMMIPVPAAGTFRDLSGLDTARGVPGIEELTLTVHRGDELVPLPEGHRYVGFIFARGATPGEVEQALRTAHGKLTFRIE